MGSGSALTGVILAGGKSRRMGGSHKALLPFRDEIMITRQIRLMRQACTEIIVVTNELGLFAPWIDQEIRIIADQFPDTGPLGGIHAAMLASSHLDLWVVGCDMPYIAPQAARLMANYKARAGCDAVIPFVNHRLHPLHGIYSKSAASVAANLLESHQYRVMGFLEQIRMIRMTEGLLRDHGFEPGFTWNMNTPEEYKQALERLSNDSL